MHRAPDLQHAIRNRERLPPRRAQFVRRLPVSGCARSSSCHSRSVNNCRVVTRVQPDGRYPAAMLQPRPMATFLSTFLVPIAIGAVAVVLLLGLANMMRGGSPNTSQKLMRLRVLLQFVAIIVIMFTIWLMGRW